MSTRPDKAVAIAAVVTAIAFAIWIGLIVGVALGGGITLAHITALAVGLAFLGFATGAVAIALGADTGSKALATAVAAAVGILCGSWQPPWSASNAGASAREGDPPHRHPQFWGARMRSALLAPAGVVRFGGTACLCVLFATLTACGGAMPSHASRSRPVLAPPPCTSAGDQARRISSIRTAWVWVGREPFGVAMTPDGRWSFVSTARGLAVLSDRTFAPRLVRTLALPSATQGLALTPDGRYLLAADNGSGAIVIDARRAEQGEPHAMLGMLSSRAGEGAGAIEVSISPDGRYAFVSLEASGGLAAFDLQAAIAARFRSSGFVGTIPVKVAPVGVAVSRDGRWLYATSELAPGSNPLLPTAHGTLSVIDVKRAETDPARSVVATATAGCTPVRAAVSPDGQTVWVTARGSNALLGFSTARLLTRPTGALISVVRVGREPVGLALFDHGARALVADSNRSGRGLGELSIVGTWPTPGGRPSLLGAAPAGRFPRDIAIQPNGRTALVTSFGSGQLQIIDLSHTP